ncbi:MAG TPA: amidohydrolase family protein [Vicinamibacterales bacterium]
MLPIVSPPLRDAWVTVRRGRIVAVGQRTPPPGRGVEERDLGRSALMPGLVNAHTHLELSPLWGKVAPARSLPAWVRVLLERRAAIGTPDPGLIRQAIADALEAGTAAIGDVSNTLAAVPAIARSRLHAVVFHELLGFQVADPEPVLDEAARARAAAPQSSRVRLAVAPHAPYSVSPPLLAAIAAEARSRNEVWSIHLGESPEEVELLMKGRGAWREFLEERGAWNPAWACPGCRPVEYLERLGVLGPRLLAVHGVQLTDAELRTLAAHGATLVTCPRSNVWVGVGNPPVARFYTSGVRVAIGTDSLASGTDLNVFSEVAAMHHLAPEIPPARLLASATREGALALGLDDLGAIAPGMQARLITVDLPRGLRDVETYLTEGVDPGQIAWI